MQDTAPAGGPVRLRQANTDTPSSAVAPTSAQALANTPAKPSEFESFVNLPRFGTSLVNELASIAPDYNPVVPPDYVIQAGDEIQVTIWGTVDADLRLLVDRSGRVNIPRVGPVLLAGVRFADLQPTLIKRVSQVFRNFELSASLGRLRGVRVYVTGFVQRPGSYVVNGLSTVLNAVMRAGGPSASGSFRQVELRRDGQAIAALDLYDLILRGDRTGDRVVLPDDVIHVPPAAVQVALRGSVNQAAVYDLKPGETLRDLLKMAGGFSPVADNTRVALERLESRNAQRVVELVVADNDGMVLKSGDVVRVFSAVESSLSVQRQNKRVRIEGEVARPGEYVLPPQSTLTDAIRAAGGVTGSAYPYAANFTRESVRKTQQENLDRALSDMETDLIRSSSTQRVTNADEAATLSARSSANTRLVERLRTVRPTGRVVFQLNPEATELPDILLEDGDRLVLPAKPTSVGIFGSVFNSGSYLYSANRSLDEYLRLAGGPTKGADEASVFVVRANGQVVSSRQQRSTWFSRGNLIGNERAEPGDTIFVPEEFDKSTLLQSAKDWTLLLYQLGVGAAGIASAIK